MSNDLILVPRDLLREVIGVDVRRPSGCGYHEAKMSDGA